MFMVGSCLVERFTMTTDEVVLLQQMRL